VNSRRVPDEHARFTKLLLRFALAPGCGERTVPPGRAIRRGHHKANSLVYFCYIHRASGQAPHFEVLPETSHVGAMEHAAQMMAQRADAIRAEIWDGDRLVFSLPRAAAPREGASHAPR